jgi:uncharacterized iron-regulated membrane protein
MDWPSFLLGTCAGFAVAMTISGLLIIWRLERPRRKVL